MPSTKVFLAHGVQVPIETIGAHIEAYKNLLPTIETLRLCNRYGEGETATVAKLPVELVQEIEDYLMEEQRATLLKAWKKDFKCWKGECKPIEHFSKDEIVEIYNEQREIFADFQSDSGSDYDFDHDLPVSWRKSRKTKKYSKLVREYVVERLRDEFASGEEWRDGYWRPNHDKRVEGWFARVGSPTSKRRGLMGDFSNILKKHFGLQVWISHASDNDPTRYMDEIVTGSTLAYLHLPKSFSIKQDWEKSVTDPDYEPRRVRTEAGCARNVDLPDPPSIMSLARFGRALKILGCEPDEDDVDEEETVRPRLKMFVHDMDEEEDMY